MKKLLPITAFLAMALCLHSELPAPWPMPASLPSIPAGVNSASYAFPKIAWLERVKGNNDNAAKIAEEIHLVFDGDSITDNWHKAGKQIWLEHYAKLGAFDFGISGDRTENLLWRLSQGQLNKIHPKLVLLMIGTNNLISNTNEEIAQGIKAIIDQYRKLCPDSVILLQGIFPCGNEATDPSRTRIKEINKIIATYADGNNVRFLDFGDKFLEADGTMSPEVMPDFLHPSAKGYQIWADAIQPVIDQCFPPVKSVPNP
ncbi:MAG: GDSL-type esterase/lipase family protein [Verrucomicrobia bacterium]|nr:GDSL-type esterase/lipase family protein [Verrucomicrobiota bacterium]